MGFPAPQPQGARLEPAAYRGALVLGLSMRTKRPGAGWSGMKRRSGNPAPDPWLAKVLFGLLLTVLVVSEAALYSGVATIPENWPLG